MSETLRIVWVAYTLASLLVGCGRKNEATDTLPNDASHHARHAIQSTADLRRLLIPSLGTNEIIRSLGEPRWQEDLGKGQRVWHYSLPAFPADDAMQGSYVTGVAVGITNGHLSNWGCSYAGSANDGVSHEQAVLARGKGQADSPAIQLFVVRSDAIDDGRFIDTERFPRLGYIARSPIMAIRRLKDVTLDERVHSEGQSRTNWSFGIFLTHEDGAQLKIMTATNISTKLLIMVGKEPISAPTITAPLETGSLVIECQDRLLMESVKKQLAEMERQGQ